MARVSPELWRGKTNKKGEHPIYLRLEADGRHLYFSLRIYVKPGHWNPDSEDRKVKAKNRRADAYNKVIRDAINTVNDEIDRLRNKVEITPELLKAALLPVRRDRTDLFAFGDTYAKELRIRGKIPTAMRYESIMRKMRVYAGQTLPFSAVNLRFLRDYESYMIGTLGNSESTAVSNFRAIKSLINRAIKAGLVSRNDSPFLNFPVVEPRATKHKLSVDEIDRIVELNLEEDTSVWHARNYFLFSFYCAGIRFRDICLLKVKNVTGGRLEYTMRKTGTPKSIGLVGPAKAIISNYLSDESQPDDFLFPLLKGRNTSTPEAIHLAARSRNVVVNGLLKEIGRKARLSEKLSFHQSRHAWADHARREGWDVYKISKALGHTDLKTTENYLMAFDVELIDEEMRRLFPEKG